MSFILKVLFCGIILTWTHRPLDATSSDHLNVIEAPKMYRAFLEDPEQEIFTPQEKQASDSQTFLWQNVIPDPTGVFRLHFDPDLYRQTSLFLFLKNQNETQNKPVALVSYQNNIFGFIGFKDASFDLTAPRYQPTGRTYLGQNLRGEEEGQFTEQDVSGDGNCALHCLGISRSEAVRLLREHGRTNDQIRRRVKPDIQAYLIEHPDYLSQFPARFQTFQRLEAEEDNQRNRRSRLQVSINDRLVEAQIIRDSDRMTETAAFLSHQNVEEEEKTQLQEAEQAFLAATQAAQTFLIDPTLYDNYIRDAYGSSSGWFSYSPNPGATMALDALCEIKGLNLTVKQMTPEGVLKTVHTHHTQEGGVEKILWHTSGARHIKTSYAPREELNHFSLLTPTSAQNPTPSVQGVTNSAVDWITPYLQQSQQTFWPHCQIHVQENVTLHNGSFHGSAEVHGKNITLRGSTFATHTLTVQAQEACHLEDTLWTTQLKVKANDLQQQSHLRCHKGYFDVQQGHAHPTSFVQADQDIVLKGFGQFIQQGDLRAKRFMLIEGDHLHRHPDAYTFAGALYLTTVSQYQDQGQTTAWQHQLKAQRILFDQTSRWIGHYLFVHAASDNELMPAVLKTAPGSQITLGFAGHLRSDNRLVHQGDLSLSADLSYRFPPWEYWLGTQPRDPSHTTPAFRQALYQLSQDMSGPRHSLKEKVKDIEGIYLEAQGTLEQKGNLNTPFTSTQIKAGKILFSGRHQGGLLPGNETWINADCAIYQGQLNAPQDVHFDIKQHLTLGGDIKASLLQAIVPEIILTGRTHTDTLDLDTSTIKVAQNASHTATKSMSLLAQDQFDNQGQLFSQGDIVLKGPKTYHLGHLHADNCFHFAPHELPPIYDLYHSPDPALTQNGGLNLVSGRHEVFDRPLNLAFHIGLKALSITIQQPLTSPVDLYFESTQGPIQVHAPLLGRTLDMISAQAIDNTGLIKLTQNGRFKSQGSFVNSKQILADQGQIDVDGASIANTGNQSKIIAQTVTLKARESHLTNEGRLQGSKYLEGVAAGNIVSKGLAHHPDSGGGGFLFGSEEENAEEAYFLPACMEGGQGLAYRDPQGQTRKLGLRLQAGGKVENYVSYFLAPLDIVITGQQGISHWGDKIKYVAYHDEDEGFLGFSEKEVTVWKELVGQAEVISLQGRVLSYSPQGGVSFKAAQEIGADGDVIVALNDIEYHALISETIKKVESSTWWGASEDSEKEIHQDAVVTQLINQGPLEHVSITGRIYGQAPLIQAPIYKIRSQKPAIFEGVKLQHHYEHKHRSCVPSFFGSSTFRGGSVRKALSQEDPLLQQYMAFRQSHTPAARLASGVKLGVQAWNDFKNLTQAQSTLMFLAERYGNVGIEFGRSKYTHDYTTTQSPLFDVGVADFGDMTEVRLLDGTVLLAKDQVILPQHLILGNATDTREERFKSTSTGIGLNVFTEMPSVSYSQNKSQSTQQTHRNAVVHIYGPAGVLDATRTQSLTLDGGRIIAPRAQGRVDQVTVTSHQDQATSSQSGFGFGISGTLATGPRGSVQFSQGRAYEQVVHDEAGLKIQDPTGFSIGNLTVTGPTLDANLAALANQVTFHPLKDDKSSWSFQGNLSNLDLSSPEKFFHSLKSSVTQAVKAALAAELTHQAGGTGLLPSAAGIIAGLDLTNDGTTQDVNITGGFSFNDGKRQFEVPFVNFNSKPTPSFSYDQPSPQELLNNREAEIFQALQQEGATEDEANTVLNDPELSWLRGQGQSFDENWHHRIKVETLMPEPGIINPSLQVSEERQPTSSTSTFLHQALSSCEQAALTLDRFAQAHPNLSKYAAMSLQMGLGGPTRYLVREAADYLGGDQVRETQQAGVAYLSRQLNIPEQDVEVVTSSLNFGLSLFLNKAKGVLKDAQYVSKAVKDRSTAFTIKPLDVHLTKRIEKNVTLSKEQPWVVRPGQEWKEKIYGKAQVTGTKENPNRAHAIRSYRTAIGEAKKPDIETVYLNRGVKKATREDIKPNTRPDVSSVTKDGKVNQFEVPSKTDTPDHLLERMNKATEKFSSTKRGKNDLAYITGPKK